MSRIRSITSGLRGRLVLSVTAAIALVLAGLTVAFDLVLADRLNADANGVVEARASAELASLRVSRDRILLSEAPDDLSPDIQIWVFEDNRAIERPRSATPGATAAAATLARDAPALRDVPGTSTRLHSLPVVKFGHRLGTVVAGVSLTPYEETRHIALVTSVILALAVLIAVGVAAWWLTGRALRPVAQMTRQASEWSEQDLDRRFALGPAKDEITQLGNTLDDLLDRLAASLRHEQRLSAEISHELRTPVANISAEAQYALRHGQQSPEDRIVLEHILASARQLGRTLDTLMAAARAQFDLNSATSDAVACAQNATGTALEHHADRKLEFSVLASDKPIRVGAEPELVERILAPLLDNAARHAHTRVHVIVERDGDHVELIVEDDGPGVPEEERDAVFEPGRRARGSAASATLTSHGAGLGLALCRRLARSAGGEVHAGPSDAGGRFIVRLPAA